jgi:hypothetical protein
MTTGGVQGDVIFPATGGFKGGVNHPFAVSGFSCPRMSVPAIALGNQRQRTRPFRMGGWVGDSHGHTFSPLSPLKDKAVFVLDGYQERVLALIDPPVTLAVMLNFDDDALELAYFVIREQGPEQGVVLSGFALVANEDRHDTTPFYHLAEPFDAQVQHGLEFIKGRGIAQVIPVFRVPDDVPVGRMIPDHVILFIRQWARHKVPSLA